MAPESARALAWLGIVIATSTSASLVACGGDDNGAALIPPNDAAVTDSTTGNDRDADPPAGDAAVDQGSPATCDPTLSGTPAYKPPTGYPKAACSSAQIAQILTDCYGSTFSKTKCDADKTTLAGCYGCMVTDESAAALGPLVHSGAFSTVNYPGCLALLQHDAGSCASQSGLTLDCQLLACATPCTGLDAGSSDRVGQYNACIASSIDAGGPCAADNAAISCPPSDPAYATCYANNAPFATYAARVAEVFCGGLDGGVADAGDGGASDAGDAGAGDASDAATDAPDGD